MKSYGELELELSSCLNSVRDSHHRPLHLAGRTAVTRWIKDWVCRRVSLYTLKYRECLVRPGRPAYNLVTNDRALPTSVHFVSLKHKEFHQTQHFNAIQHCAYMFRFIRTIIGQHFTKIKKKTWIHWQHANYSIVRSH